LKNVSISAFELLELISLPVVFILLASEGDALGTPLPSKSRNKSRAEGVRIASVGRLETLPPLRNKS
jgi:hypothetical protein